MYVLLALCEDGDSYLQYALERIDIGSKSIEFYTDLYPNKFICLMGKYIIITKLYLMNII